MMVLEMMVLLCCIVSVLFGYVGAVQLLGVCVVVGLVFLMVSVVSVVSVVLCLCFSYMMCLWY